MCSCWPGMSYENYCQYLYAKLILMGGVCLLVCGVQYDKQTSTAVWDMDSLRDSIANWQIAGGICIVVAGIVGYPANIYPGGYLGYMIRDGTCDGCAWVGAWPDYLYEGIFSLINACLIGSGIQYIFIGCRFNSDDTGDGVITMLERQQVNYGLAGVFLTVYVLGFFVCRMMENCAKDQGPCAGSAGRGFHTAFKNIGFMITAAMSFQLAREFWHLENPFEHPNAGADIDTWLLVSGVGFILAGIACLVGAAFGGYAERKPVSRPIADSGTLNY